MVFLLQHDANIQKTADAIFQSTGRPVAAQTVNFKDPRHPHGFAGASKNYALLSDSVKTYEQLIKEINDKLGNDPKKVERSKQFRCAIITLRITELDSLIGVAKGSELDSLAKNVEKIGEMVRAEKEPAITAAYEKLKENLDEMNAGLLDRPGREGRIKTVVAAFDSLIAEISKFNEDTPAEKRDAAEKKLKWIMDEAARLELVMEIPEGTIDKIKLVDRNGKPVVTGNPEFAAFQKEYSDYAKMLVLTGKNKEGIGRIREELDAFLKKAEKLQLNGMVLELKLQLEKVSAAEKVIMEQERLQSRLEAEKQATIDSLASHMGFLSTKVGSLGFEGIAGMQKEVDTLRVRMGSLLPQSEALQSALASLQKEVDARVASLKDGLRGEIRDVQAKIDLLDENSASDTSLIYKSIRILTSRAESSKDGKLLKECGFLQDLLAAKIDSIKASLERKAEMENIDAAYSKLSAKLPRLNADDLGLEEVVAIKETAERLKKEAEELGYLALSDKLSGIAADVEAAEKLVKDRIELSNELVRLNGEIKTVGKATTDEQMENIRKGLREADRHVSEYGTKAQKQRVFELWKEFEQARWKKAEL